MKKIFPTRLSVFFVFALLSSIVFSQNKDLYDFNIQEGVVKVTPAFCPPEACETSVLELSGQFVGFLPGGATQLFFTSSNLVTEPDIDFQLPSDPNGDSDGTSRNLTFSFTGELLKVSGVVDSRAFDGPYIEYEFVAEAQPMAAEVSYFTARPDYRKCVAPLCGGYYVKKVNKKRTRCADGTKQAECYVAELDFKYKNENFSNTSFSNLTPLLLAGSLTSKNFEGFGELGVFNATDVQYAASPETAMGRFFGVENNGVMCITTPCFSYELSVLNRDRSKGISAINFDKSGADPADIERAQALLASGVTLYASGRNKRYKGFSGKGVEFVVNQFYLPPLASKSCEEGYELEEGACRTPYGCEFPQLELTGYGGAAMVDPITGELTSTITKSCVDSCDAPAELQSPGQCVVYYP